jgi:glycosyltransferase involved in cell wall biosynthesis|tara:strand:+ start:420 stop:1058 length:639 start_codon:yes stop_codon:yes gene_type:complete
MSKNLIIIPSFNEKTSLLKILKKIENKNYVLVMDDCSTDETSKIIQNRKKLKIISNKKNYGYEKNLLKAFRKVINSNFEYVITFDADGEHDFKDIEKIKKYLKIKKPDLLIGTRAKKNRFAESVVGVFFKFFYKLEDPLSGFKAYRIDKLRNVIKEIKNDFYLVDIIKLFLKKQYKVDSIKINSNIFKKRIARVGSNFKASIKILKCIKLLI